MDTRRITKRDFDRIAEVIDHWWGGPIGTLAHPIFFYELGDMALVVEESSEMIGFLLGFIAHQGLSPHAGGPAVKTGYVHLVGIHPEHRRKGVGRQLYANFTRAAVDAGCQRLKAITTTGNEGSLRFHVAQGWQAAEIDDYAGPGRKRIVFSKELAS
jgi:GNAT superfamily N-acetyltransferase